jgi:hypothetical protein
MFAHSKAALQIPFFSLQPSAFSLIFRTPQFEIVVALFLSSFWDGQWRNTACQKPISPDNKTMSAQEILIEEIRRQPEPVVLQILHYLKFLERQHGTEAPMDSLVADTWEKLGPPPEVDYDQL